MKEHPMQLLIAMVRLTVRQSFFPHWEVIAEKLKYEQGQVDKDLLGPHLNNEELEQ